jgi:hypothetical protein
MYRWKAYNYRDIEETFLLLGHQVDNIEQKLGSYDIDPAFEKVSILNNQVDVVNTVTVGLNLLHLQPAKVTNSKIKLLVVLFLRNIFQQLITVFKKQN